MLSPAFNYGGGAGIIIIKIQQNENVNYNNCFKNAYPSNLVIVRF